MTTKRKYELKQRAERQDETRRRITEAAVELHGTVGPARTTISAIARRAEVERLTVYRHFPDGEALFRACSTHWDAANPAPDPGRWRHVPDPEARLQAALLDLYGYYRRGQGMLANIMRDADSVPALAQQVAGWAPYLDQARDILVTGWGARGRRRDLLRAALGHAVDFHAWRSLAQQGLDDGAAAELMVRLARAAAGRDT